MKVAYSYLRFSSAEQADGDSKRRQSEAAVKWCARNGYTLTSPFGYHSTGPAADKGKDKGLSFGDEGRSALHGANSKGRGKLALFLTLVEAGVIKPGSVLIIENLDRLSRQKIHQSMKLVEKIVLAGIDIVTLMPSEDRFTRADYESSSMTWMKLVWIFDRAHNESRMKSERCKENWSEKRKEIAEGKIVTAVCPFWLDVYQDGKPVPPGRGKVDWSRPVEYQPNEKEKWVKEIFRLADKENLGCFRIAQVAHERGWVFWSKTATQTEIWRLLLNRNVIGEYQAYHQRDESGDRKPIGEPTPGYYPEVVKPDVFHRVQGRIIDRRKKGKGRVGSSVTNLFSGLVYDARYKGDVPMYIKGNATRGRTLVNFFGLKKKPGYINWEFPYPVFEAGVLKACRELSPSLLMPRTPAADLVAELEAELKEHGLKIDRAKGRLQKAKDEAEEEAAHERYAGLIRQRKELEGKLDEAKTKVSSQPSEQLHQLHNLLDQMDKAEDKVQFRNLVRGLVHALVSRIDFFQQRRGTRGKYERRCWVWVTFNSGLVRKLLVEGAGVMTVADECPNWNVTTAGGWV